MRSPEERDEQTLVIASALGLFVLTLAAFAALTATAAATTDRLDVLGPVVGPVAFVVAGLVAAHHLVRDHRRQ